MNIVVSILKDILETTKSCEGRVPSSDIVYIVASTKASTRSHAWLTSTGFSFSRASCVARGDVEETQRRRLKSATYGRFKLV